MNVVRSKTLSRVLKGQLCSGCGLCAGVSQGAIVMGDGDPGYNRPKQVGPISASAEKMIETSCPGSKVAPWPADKNVHPYWGPTITIASGFSTDAEVRYRASSGGAITALASHALQSGYVDRIVQIASSKEDPTGNRLVISRSITDILSAAGSRYVSSSPLAEIDHVLAEGGRAAFVGKPCDVSALRQLGAVDARVAAHVPLMLSFFCAGVPSRGAVGRLLQAMGVSRPVSSFRYRGHGWPGLATAVDVDDQVHQMSYEDSWGGHLSKEVQFRCKICPDAVGGVADIACADAWYGGEAGYPTFEELDGRSLIATRTASGEQLLRDAIAAGAIRIEPLAAAEIELMQPSQAARKRLVRARVAALKVLGRPRPVMAGLRLDQAARKSTRRASLRNFLGTIRRALKGSLSRR